MSVAVEGALSVARKDAAAGGSAFYTGLLYSLSPVVHGSPISAEILEFLVEARSQRPGYTPEMLTDLGLDSLIQFKDGRPAFAPVVPARKMGFVGNGRSFSLYVISGNAWRGLARRLVARFTLEALGLAGSDVPLDVLRPLYSGGVLARNLKVKLPGTASFDSELRSAVPLFDVFGGCLNGFMVPGALRVGFAVPITEESAGTILSEARFAGICEIARAERGGVLPDLAALKPQTYTYTRQRVASLLEADDGDKQQMIYSVEAVPAGLHYAHWVSLAGAAGEGSRRCLEAAIALVAKSGHLGGKGAAGHGLFSFRYWNAEGEPLDFDECLERYRAWLEEHRAEARDMLQRRIMEETGYRVPDQVKKALRAWLKCRGLGLVGAQASAEPGDLDAGVLSDLARWLKEGGYLDREAQEPQALAWLQGFVREAGQLSEELVEALEAVTEVDLGSVAALAEKLGVEAETLKAASNQVQARISALVRYAGGFNRGRKRPSKPAEGAQGQA